MKSVRIPAKVAKDALSLFRRFDNSAMEEIDASEVVTLIGKLQDALKERRAAWVLKRPARERVKARKASRQSEWAQIREKVLERAEGKCESPGCGWEVGSIPNGYPLEVDHMFGGSNRRTLQSIFTCWAICCRCHRLKTHNHPSAAYWLEDFIKHCLELSCSTGDEAKDEPNGYAHAADIAKARLESLQIQGRAGAEP